MQGSTVLFTPGVGLTFINAVIGKTTYLTDVLLYWFWLLVLLSSFCNPLVICRQLSTLRKPVTEMLFFWKVKRQISPQGASQPQLGQADFKRSRTSIVMPTEEGCIE